jgi:hypothetical protein
VTRWVGVVFDDGGGKRYTKNFGTVVNSKAEADTFQNPEGARDCARAAKLASFTNEGATKPRYPWIDKIGVEEGGLWAPGFKMQSGIDRYLSKQGTLTEDIHEANGYGTAAEAKQIADDYALGILDAIGMPIYQPPGITGTFAGRIE